MRLTRAVGVAAVTLTTIGCAFLAFANSGNFLVVDNHEKSDVIVITQGDSLDDLYWMGIRLLKEGYGRGLILDARSDRIYFGHSQAELADDFIRRTAADLTGQVRVCPISVDTTVEEVYRLANCLKGRSIHSVLLLVDDFHCRRSLSTFSRLLPQYHWSIAALPDHARFDTHWWERRSWTRTALLEWEHLFWWEIIDRWRFSAVNN